VSWSASQYVKFEDERTRPVRDLLAAVPTRAASRAVDLGCGPGNSTELLAARYPAAETSGIDSSEDMIAAARKRLPQLRFEVADISTWTAPAPADVILANAALQWVPDHANLLPHLVAQLAAGGSLAVQMPDNLAEPSHVLMSEVAKTGPWSEKLAAVAGERSQIGSPSWHYGLLRPLCSRVDVWRTTFHHPLPGIEGVVEWFKGSALRPFLSPLDQSEQAAFLDHYRTCLSNAYDLQPDGTVLLPFPRLFVVATR